MCPLKQTIADAYRLLCPGKTALKKAKWKKTCKLKHEHNNIRKVIIWFGLAERNPKS